MTDFSQSSPASTPKFVVKFCDATIKWTLLALTFLVPLFFLPWTTETTEINKQLLLFIGVAIAGLAWLGKMLAERQFEYRRSVVNIIVLLFLGVYGISSWASQSTYMSLAGDFGQEQSGFFTILALVALYFIVSNNIRTEEHIKWMLGAMMLSGFVAALYGLLQGLGLFVLPFGFTKTAAFNTIGTAASLGIYMAFIVALVSGSLLYGHGQKKKDASKLDIVFKVFMVITAILALFIVAVIDFWPVTVSLLVSSALVIAYAFLHAKSMKGLGGILLPLAALIVSLMLLFIRFPAALGFPAEVMPSAKASVDITMKTLGAHPFFGSGPGTFVFDYAQHRAPEVNNTAFWNIRFDRASTSFMTMLATIGLLGALSWLMIPLVLLGSAARKLLRSDERTWHILIGMFSSWFLLTLAKFLYSSTLSLEFMFWIMMAMLVVVHKHDFFSVRFERSPRAAMAISFLFILGLVFTLSGLFVESQRYAAEISYSKSLQADQAGESADVVIEKLIKANRLNPRNDVYVRNLALALLMKADQLLTEPLGLEKGEEESDEDFTARQRAEASERLRQASAITANAVNTARSATEMNPANVANWTVLATVYKNLMGVTEGADEWARQSYEEAIEREPSNTVLRTELGKIYVVQADAAMAGLNTEDEEAKVIVQAKVDELLGKAVDAFNKAVELKADYAAAHYNLGLVLDRQGKLDESIARMEGVVTLNPRDVGVGFQLALLYFRNDQKDEAVALMESVVRLQPNFSNARWYLAAMYDEEGDIDKAIAEIEKVMELNPGDELVAKKIEELKTKKAGGPVESEEGEGDDLPEPVEDSGAPSVEE
ncbi:MAG: tetratricopeptide repeat protein [Patescibacteria group bacterium]|nr:tetratricopeptide repeat protein [Patescibacteria group bacterium]